MSSSKPATLDGSLLARKGDAAPAIAYDSPLLEELGEPRPNQPANDTGAEKPAGAASGIAQGPVGRGLAWLAANRVFGVLGLVIGIAILFAVAIAALNSSSETALVPDGDTSQSKPIEAMSPVVAAPTPSEPAPSAPAPSAPVMSEAVTAKTVSPSDEKSVITPPDAVAKEAVKVSQAPVVPPAKPVKLAAAKPIVPPVVPGKLSGRSGRYLLQLAAVPSARSARRELVRLEKRLGKLLGKRKIVVVKASPPGKPPVYRLRASAYESRAAARSACKQIRTRKMACLVIRR